MKTLEALKVKDGWLVATIETRLLPSESEVNKFIKQSGLNIIKHASTKERKLAE